MIIEKARQKLLILSISIWNYIFIVINLLILCLMLGSLLSQEWVSGQDWYGGILRVNGGTYSGKHYSSIPCENSNCIFNLLETAGIIMIVFELLSLLCLLVWLTEIVYHTKGMNVLKLWIRYLILSGILIFHFVGIITWGAVTKLKFNSGEVRSKTGPALSVAVSVILPVSIGVYLIVFKHPKSEKEHIPSMDSVRIEQRHSWGNVKSVEEPDNRN
ncbi:hypothetical protein SteCoe_22576 [Stentor coeruleus]|uniref:Uncharacterized protein n=1 Tax=Stentor coeruleus TaxID=5963 RepID=A0A1R2BLW2_9CILI|nr:hypothetical protein SteCoe_22576 [Stentor coeruleus]